jgi:hypothetical protein
VPAPTGEESCDDAVAPKRSRRRRPSGRSAHHQRPLDAGWDIDATEIKATLKAPVERGRTSTTSDEATSEDHIRPACASPLPCCLAASATPRFWSAIVMAVKGRHSIEGSHWAKMLVDLAATPPQTAEVDDDLTVGSLPPSPPIPSASMITWQRSVETRGRDNRTHA